MRAARARRVILSDLFLFLNEGLISLRAYRLQFKQDFTSSLYPTRRCQFLHSFLRLGKPRQEMDRA